MAVKAKKITRAKKAKNVKKPAAKATARKAKTRKNEPARVCRRPFRLSYAAMAGCSSMA